MTAPSSALWAGNYLYNDHERTVATHMFHIVYILIYISSDLYYIYIYVYIYFLYVSK